MTRRGFHLSQRLPCPRPRAVPLGCWDWAILFQNGLLFSLWQKTAAAEESKQPLSRFPFGRLPALSARTWALRVSSPCAQVHAGWVWNCTQERRGSRLHRRPDTWRAGGNAPPHRDALTRPPEVLSLSRDQRGFSRPELEECTTKFEFMKWLQYLCLRNLLKIGYISCHCFIHIKLLIIII